MKKISGVFAVVLALLVAFQSTALVFAASTVSKYTGKTYSHNSQFDSYVIQNGVDVSEWQANVDWTKVKGDGIDFAVIRAGYGKDPGQTDKYFEQNYKKYTGAVRETDDAVLFYGETYAWTPFHQSSCGMTRSAEEVVGTEEYPYLRAKECPLDKEADDEIQVFTYHYAEIQELCRDFLVAEDEKEQAEAGYAFDDFEIQSRDSAGYVKSLRIGNTVCTGDQFRDALSLPSSAFSFSESGEEMKITTTGIGHGLGMSQWTANEMAKEGSSWEEILQFFFEGTTVNREIQETELLSGTEEKYLTYSPI